MLWRGTFLLLVGQIVFLVCGYGINVVLARLLDPEGYGTFGVAYSILMIFELFVVAGIPNALQRFVGENPNRAYVLHKVMLRWQLVYTVSVFSLAIVAAPALAKFLQDQQLAAVLQIAAIDILFFSFYWYCNGLQIGLKNFGKHTIIASTYSLTKFGFIFFLVYAGFSVRGAFVGNLLGSICGLALGIWFLRLQKQGANYSQKDLTQFIVANILYTIGLNLFFYIDLWFVKYHLPESMVGHYNAASTLCRIPYFFSIALSGALLPSLSSAIAQNRTHEVERIIQQSLRLIIILVLPTMVFIATTALPIVLLLFGEKYIRTAAIAQRLIVGMTLFTVFTVTNTIAMAKNGMKGCTVIVLSLIPLDLFFNAYLVPAMGANGAAVATSLTMAIALIASSIYVIKHFKVFVGLTSIIRVLAASTALLLLSTWIQPNSHWELFVKFFLLAIVYFVLLRMTGEISGQDVQNVKAAVVSKLLRPAVLVSKGANKR